MKTIIVWFRNDLRLHDQPALAAAVQQADVVVPLFIWNDSLLHGKHASANRNRFLLECLQDLRSSLQKIDGDLILRTGQPETVLAELAHQISCSDIFYTIDYTPYARARDRRVTEKLEQEGLSMQAFPGRLAVDSFRGVEAQNGNLYKVFTPFWKNWSSIERRPIVLPPTKLTLPRNLTPGSLEELTTQAQAVDLSPDAMSGGESAGRQRLDDFLDDGIQRYGELHDTLSAGTSRLSPYLHFGCLSVREIEELLPPGDGPARFHRQLAWRDFYNYILFHNPSNAQKEFQARYRDMPWSYDEDLLRAWQDGRTGYPIIDASMRQLKREGWMHNRARLIVGSFLTKDLGLDWRLGEAHFMHILLDGDEANNNGNWQWIASVGVDPAPVFRRLYNPMTQQKRYDPEGIYVRKFVPELSMVPNKFLTEPWRMSLQEQTEAGCVIGTDYPAPIIDHATARLATLERFRTTAAA